MWRAHSCVPRRDFLDACWCDEIPKTSVETSLDTARTSACATISMLGILVHGDNHFIVRGPLPDRATALALVRHWSVIQIGATTPAALDKWNIRSREFRENLEWAVIVAGESEISPAVAQLLRELSARGIPIHEH